MFVCEIPKRRDFGVRTPGRHDGCGSRWQDRAVAEDWALGTWSCPSPAT